MKGTDWTILGRRRSESSDDPWNSQIKIANKAFHGPIKIPMYKNYGQWPPNILEDKQDRHFDKYNDLGLVHLSLV